MICFFPLTEQHTVWLTRQRLRTGLAQWNRRSRTSGQGVGGVWLVCNWQSLEGQLHPFAFVSNPAKQHGTLDLDLEKAKNSIKTYNWLEKKKKKTFKTCC